MTPNFGDRDTIKWDPYTIKWAPYSEWIAHVSQPASYYSAWEARGTGSVRIWHALTGRQVATHQGTSIDWAPDGQRFAIVTESVTGAGSYSYQSQPVIQVWDVTSGVQLATYHGASVAWAPDGRGVAITKGNDVQIWDIVHANPVATYQRQDTAANSYRTDNIYRTEAAWSSDGQRLAFMNLGRFIGSDAKTLLHVWNASTNKLLPLQLLPQTRIGLTSK